MPFKVPTLTDALKAWAADADPNERACAHNLDIEERFGARSAAFEAFASEVSDAESLRRATVDYYRERVRTPKPETFTAINRAASLGLLSGEQKLVRLESLSTVLDNTGVDFETLKAAHESGREGRALVDWVIDQWNHRPDIPRNPVAFAAFKDQLSEELAIGDWPVRLRDRLGLAHFNPIDGESIPVALMEYEVDDVLSRSDVDHHFCAPTALDGQPYGQFVPTPRELPFGCPMNLHTVNSDDELIAEIVHPRLIYRPTDLKRLGRIDTRCPSVDFPTLRNNHVWALRIAANREAFGLEI